MSLITHFGKLGKTMNRRFLTVIGVTYVAIAVAMAAFYILNAFNNVDANEGKASQLAGQTQGVNASDWGLFGLQRLPTTPEYVDGKPVKYKINRGDGDKAASKATEKQEKAAVIPKNYLVIWTADWCPVCPKIKTIGKKLEAEGFCVIYVDFNINRDEAKQLGIKLIPTSIIYTDGKEVRRLTGVDNHSEANIRAVLQKETNIDPDNYDIFQ